MTNLNLKTLTNDRIGLAEESVQALETNLLGDLILPDRDDYDESRTVWNGMIDKEPAFIARCKGIADVIEAVNFARENSLLVSVRGGGHNVAGHAVNDGGLVIDLSTMRGIQVNPHERIARVQAGVTWGELDRET